MEWAGKALAGERTSNNQFSFAGVADQVEVFSNRNPRSLVLTLRPGGEVPPGAAEAVEIRVERDEPSFYSARVRAAGSWLTDTYAEGQETVRQGDARWSLGPLLDAAVTLANSLYIPAVRNAIQVGASEPYYDLPLGQGSSHSGTTSRRGR